MEQDTPPLSNTSLAASPLGTAMASAEGLPPSAARPVSTESPLSPTPIRRRPLPTVSPTRPAAPSATSPRIVSSPSPSIASASTPVPTHQDNMSPPTSGQGADTESESSSSPAANVKLPKSRSSSAAKVLENEIIVSTTEANDESLLIPPAPGLADVTMEDASNAEDAGELVDEGKSPKSLLPKRKRLSAFKEVKEKAVERPTRGVGRPHKTSLAQPQPQPQPPQKSIVLGYWRDSTVPNRKDRHAVIGFIDTRDRLRTRIQNATRTGEKVPPGHSSPPGPGGSWVTFERIVFEKHLIGLDHNEVKEYVRLLTDPSLAPELTDGPNQPTEKDIVSQAIRRAAQNPVPDNPPTPHIAYGVDLPDYVVNAGRPDKKQRVGSSSFQVPLAAAEPARGSTSAAPLPPPPPPPSHGTIVPFGSPSVASAIQQSAIDLLPGTRPTKILLGFWRGSSEEREEDKHAVFGILGANDMFRVKVTRETRDGRPVFGNFPTGAGALWIHYEEVELEKHLRHLSRPEVKEYVRVRQRQIDEGETPAQAAENESIAVSEAQSRILSAGGGAQNTFSFSSAAHISCEPNRGGDFTKPFITLQEGPHLQSEYSAGSDSSTTRRSSELREHTTSSLAAAAVAAASAANAATPYATRSGRHSLLDGIDMATARRYSTGNGPNEANHSQNSNRVEQTNSLARREVARIETIQIRNDQRAASRDIHGTVSGGYGPGSTTTGGSLAFTNMGTNSQGIYSAANTSAGSSSRQLFNENIGRLNKVWAAQEASRLRAGGEDAKIYMGVKYERKQTGPFQGKLVSPGIILSIDGEDYVEYRVLTKPTFF